LNDVISAPTRGVTWLLIANCLERLAFYGFRGAIVLFLIDQTSGGMGWPTDKTLEFYGEFTIYTYIAMVVGGLCADFLFGAYVSTLLGAALMAFGYASLGFIDDQFIYYSIGLIAIGAGLFKPSIPTMLTHQLQKFPEKLDSVFTGQYLVVNFGALLGPLIVGLVGESVGWSIGFSISAAVITAVFFILLSQKKHFSEQSKRSNIKTMEKGAGFFSGISVVILTSLLAVLFWTYFEVGGGILYELFPEEMSGIDFSLNAITVIISCVLCFALWWFFKVSSWYKVAISFLIFAVSWFILKHGISNNSDIKQTLILVMVSHAIAEVFCSAIFMSIIAKRAFKPLLSTSFSVHLYASAFANFVASKFTQESSNFETFGWVCLTVAILLAIVQLSYNQYSKKRLLVT
jgi:POT family proton-dependent oligopeptide transporter